MMTLLVSTAGRGFRGLVSSSKTSPRTLLGRSSSSLNTSASLLCAGQRFISSSSGRRNSATERASKSPFTPPPPPSTPEEQEELKKMYQEMQKLQDVLMSELRIEDPFKAQKLPDNFFIDESDLTDEQKVLSAQMDSIFSGINTSNNILPPELMEELFGEADPLKVNLYELEHNIQRSQGLAENEILDEDDNIITFHLPHTLNETNSFVDNCGNRRHFDDAGPEDCFDDEGEVIPEVQAHFLAKHRVQPEFYPKKRDPDNLKKAAELNQEALLQDELVAACDFYTDQFTKEGLGPVDAEMGILNEDEADEIDETDETDEADEADEIDKADETGEADEDEIDSLGFTEEERGIMENGHIPDLGPITEEDLDKIEKGMEEEDADEEIEAEQDGSEERSVSQKDDEFSDDGTFELNKFVTDRKVVVGNDSASSNANSSANDEKQLQEFTKIVNRLSQTFVRSLTEPGFRAEVSPFIKRAEKGSPSKKASDQSFDADFDEFVKKN